MTTRWRDAARTLGRSVRRGLPRLLRRTSAAAPIRQTPSRPTKTAPTRTVTYSPQLDGRADPGEIVWAWVSYEDDPAQGKDRPVLVVARAGAQLSGLMLSSQHDRDGQPHWFPLGPWDRDGRPSWVRLDRVLELTESGIRREGAVLDRKRFDAVAKRLRSSYGWH